MPGVTMTKLRPQASRMSATSCGDATTPSIAGFFGQSAKAHDLIGDFMLDADALQIVLIQARQHRHRQHDRPALIFLAANTLHFFHRHAHHFQTAGSVDVEHFDAEARRFDGRFGDGVGNIVKLEIEKNFAAEILNQADRLGAGVGEELLADLEHADFAGEQSDQLCGLLQGVDIESDDQAARAWNRVYAPARAWTP